MKSIPLASIAVLLFAGAATLPAQEAPPASPALIYAGWFGDTIPTPAYIRDHQAFLDSQPFHGLAIYMRDPGMTVNASTRVMTTVPISYSEIAFTLAPLQGLSFTTLKENFALVFGNTPADFFDDWTTTLQNFSNLAGAVRDAGLTGVFFDNEQYFSPWGAYGSTKYLGSKSLADYQAQARLRGRQVMEAMTAQFPAIVVLTLHGPYLSELDAPPPLFPQWQNGNELLGPFFAGFMQGTGSFAENVDGGELYTLRSEAEFASTYEWRKNTIASEAVDCPFIPAADRPAWPSRTSISFGVYDQPFGGAPMNSAIAKTTLLNALNQSDRWVWFYTEGPSFLKPASQGGASQAWVDAVRGACQEATPNEPGPGAPLPPAGGSPPATGQPGSSSSCGLLGGEAALVILGIGLVRRRFTRRRA